MTPRMFLVPAMTLALVTGCVPKEGLPLGKPPASAGEEGASRETPDQAQETGSLRLSFTGEVMDLLEPPLYYSGELRLAVRVVPAEGEARDELLLSYQDEEAARWSDLRVADLAPGDATVTVKLSWSEQVLFERSSTLNVSAGKELKAAIALTLDPAAGPQARPALARFVGHAHVGHVDGLGFHAKLGNAGGMALDASGNLYVAESDNNVIRKITPTGVVTTFAGRYDPPPAQNQWPVGGMLDGPRRAAKFQSPANLAFDAAGNLYVSDAGNNRIRRITPAGDVQTVAGTGERAGATWVDGPGLTATFSGPGPLAFASDGTLYVADETGIRTVAPDGTVATFVPMDRITQAYLPSSPFLSIQDMAFGPEGALYLLRDHRVLKVTPDKQVLVVAGSGSFESVDDPEPLKASFLGVAGMVFESPDSLLIVDSGKLRRVSLSGGGVTTVKAHDGADLDFWGSMIRFEPGGYYVDGGKNKLFL